MTLAITPKDVIDSLIKGEGVAFRLNLNDELDGNTVDTFTFKIYNRAGEEKTSTFGGGSSETDGYITFGIKTIDTGTYTLEFWVTCNEFLPDGSTPYEFFVKMIMTIS